MPKVRDEKFTGCTDCVNYRAKPWICRRCDCGEEFEEKDQRGALDDLTWGDGYDE